MWALVESGSVSKIFTKPTQLTIGDIKYPRNIFQLWSESELKAIGIYEVVQDDTNKKDKEYYINTEQSFAFANNTVTATYGTATAKPLDDSGSGENLVKGLKTLHKESVDGQAYALLQSNDWLVIRKEEAGTAIPSDWSTFRTNVRSTASTMKGLIDDVTDVDGLEALYVYNDANPPVRPLGEWPTAPSS
ncbi:MAG TPA: hypothetical protein DCM10_12385 [Xanthomarina gelatinilytica]|nr:hypothetical protein [Xanthomarina gelatinilytica]